MSVEPDVISMSKQPSEKTKPLTVETNHKSEEQLLNITSPASRNLFLLRKTDGVKELHTVIRDK